jgi:hypothetical protein
MSVPRVRFTVRRMMVAVILAGICVGGYVLWARSRYFGSRAVIFAREESEARDSMQFYRDHWEEGRESVRRRTLQREQCLAARSDQADHRLKLAVIETNIAADENWLEFAEYEIATQGRRSEYFARMKLKYRRAALYPWLPVAPDAPKPE